MILDKGVEYTLEPKRWEGEGGGYSVSHLQVCERLALGVNSLPGILQCLILEKKKGGGQGRECVL